MADEPTTDTPGFDLEAAAEKIGSEVWPKSADGPVAEGTVEPAPEPQPDVIPPTPTEPPVRAVPKAWPKEMHEHWGKVDPKVQEYLDLREKQIDDGFKRYDSYSKPMRDVLEPYKDLFTHHRLEPHQAVQSLLQAHTRLTQGPMEQRQAAYEELGRNLGITQPTQNGNQAPVDPALKAMQDEMQSVKQTLLAQQQAAYDAAVQESNKEVEAFASDKSHPYFDEVADDIVTLIKAGYTLADAYDKAVWANPVTREKELAKAREAEAAKLKENARLDALKAKTASSTNVKSRDTKGSPRSEPVGTIEQTAKETLRAIRDRVAH